jgi:hypothetical protein
MSAKARNAIVLPSYNVEQRGNFWFYWKTPFFCLEAEPKGPYGSLRSVCLMIGIELFKEAMARFAKH